MAIKYCVPRIVDEHEVVVGNYFHGTWIDHPVQANLYQVPEPLRTKCVNSFLQTVTKQDTTKPNNYRQWLERSVGKEITERFVAPYTKKYWTTDPKNLGVYQG